MSSLTSMPSWPRGLTLCLALAGGAAHAQSASAPSAPSSGSAASGSATAGAGGNAATAAAANANAAAAAAALSDAERARRDADKVFQWIKFHAEKAEPKKPEKHEARAESKPEPKAVAKATPTAVTASRKPDADVDGRSVAAASATPPASVGGTSSMAAAVPGPANVGVTASSGSVPSLASGASNAVPSLAAENRGQDLAPMGAAGATPAAALASPAPAAAAVQDDDAPLKLLKKVEPEYPRALLAQQRNGAVVVRFMVQPDGTVEYVEALRSPDRKLSTAAVTAVKQWRFAPIPKARQVSVEIGFQVE
ncbi:energy transducer TonB [Roseateles amylovorans]|uniref:Energy transducer TonB n=1 Tax=Roseateles amylovorans TaxID=2978473 RepID=A0ABY6AYU2_9BURK|nr:energy transducer TonB [Roseateles amylovorans]UXH77852.1 energy transducer TonB [Roseateles amylovorans]